MIFKISKIEPVIIFLLITSQLSTFTILTLIFQVNDSLLQAFKYISFLLPLIYFIKGFKIEIRMLFVIAIFTISLIINDIDSKFNSNLRFLTWLIMISTIGPLFYSYNLNTFKEKLLNIFLYTLMILGAISFIYWLIGLESIGRGHFSGVFAHSMILAPVSAIGTIFSVYKFYLEKKIIKNYYFAILIIFNFLSLILSASRSALAALLISLFIFIIFANLKYKKVIISLGIVIAIISNTFISINLDNNDFTKTIASRGFDNTREILWHDRLLEFNNNIFFGVGFAAQDDNIKGKIGKKGSSEGVIEPGSTYLMVLSMTGLFGTISLVIFFFKYIISISFLKNNLFNINYKVMLFIFFLIHFIAEGYIFSSGSAFAFIFWLLVSVTYPNKYNNINEEVNK